VLFILQGQKAGPGGLGTRLVVTSVKSYTVTGRSHMFINVLTTDNKKD